eukprot:TRINITY_DN2123_c0_g1_i1.p1 TRINITY_DN2123_c0_g1~~TRINITY_DN2123_c0_g1_i1.p1  ORF type:complete len:189 (-),score=23.83 TRINITY_DN2123_c0_g1_i1:24-590(-)
MMHSQSTRGCYLVLLRDPSKNITFIQQRAPTIKGYARDFAKELSTWIKDNKFSHVLVLASVDATYRHDSQIRGQQVRYVIGGDVGQRETRLNEIQMQSLEERSYDLLFKKGSLTEGLYEECKNITQVTVLAIFCSEGDNIMDSMILTHCANLFIQAIPPPASGGSVQWRSPNSWRAMESNNVNTSLFQ